MKKDKPSWGAPKIRERLARLYPDVHTPAISTVHAVLDRHGERIKPGNPQQNGRHERMHLTLKLEATKPAARNFLQHRPGSMTSSIATTTSGLTSWRARNDSNVRPSDS
jgi:hypothetical protein